jgi:hypothetical protein
MIAPDPRAFFIRLIGLRQPPLSFALSHRWLAGETMEFLSKREAGDDGEKR